MESITTLQDERGGGKGNLFDSHICKAVKNANVIFSIHLFFFEDYSTLVI
jgi:hypothetical protein